MKGIICNVVDEAICAQHGEHTWAALLDAIRVGSAARPSDRSGASATP